jgi:lysophospholipase L1-like esterase
VAKRDYHTEPFQKVVVLGESHVATRNGWVSMFGELLRDAQGTGRLEVINAGIGGNAISPRSPGYAASAKPSALERFRDDVIAHQPDLVIISYGLNDMRAGMDPMFFREDLSQIVREVRQAVDPVMVLTTVYNMSTYGLYPPFDKGSVEATEVYNRVVCQVAERYDALVADIWDAEGKAPWLISVDTVHANPLGHRVIAQRVFQTVVTNCSGAAYAVKPEVPDVKAELERYHQGAIDRVIRRLEAIRDHKAK